MLRLAGLDGADGDGMPWVNRLADAVRETAGLEHGVALPAWDALLSGGYPDLAALARDAAAGAVQVPGARGPTTRLRPGAAARPRWPGLRGHRRPAGRADRDDQQTAEPPRSRGST